MKRLFSTVQAEKKTAICLHCGRFSDRVHQNHGHLVKDLRMGNRKVIFRVNPRQLKCNNWKKTFSETLSFLAKRQGFTNRYAVMMTE